MQLKPKKLGITQLSSNLFVLMHKINQKTFRNSPSIPERVRCGASADSEACPQDIDGFPVAGIWRWGLPPTPLRGDPKAPRCSTSRPTTDSEYRIQSGSPGGFR
ncbi:MAG: hypothetical protein HC862_15280 [Scytonema sp. RU_4_4]|nr:hypothetical protein [Scytonema sp. RU_4_4]